MDVNTVTAVEPHQTHKAMGVLSVPYRIEPLWLLKRSIYANRTSIWPIRNWFRKIETLMFQRFAITKSSHLWSYQVYARHNPATTPSREQTMPYTNSDEPLAEFHLSSLNQFCNVFSFASDHMPLTCKMVKNCLPFWWTPPIITALTFTFTPTPKHTPLLYCTMHTQLLHTQSLVLNLVCHHPVSTLSIRKKSLFSDCPTLPGDYK